MLYLFELMLFSLELMAKPPLSRGLAPPIKEPNVRSATVSGTAAVLPRFAAVFLVGMTLGSVLSEPKTEPIQIASMD
jgi:hypothetical protein